MRFEQSIRGIVSVIVMVDVWDNRLGIHGVVGVQVYDVYFEGSYRYYPGVRWYGDGCGEPPSDDWEVDFAGGIDDIAAEVDEDLDRDSGRWTLLETRESLGTAVNEAIEEAIEDHVCDYIVF